MKHQDIRNEVSNDHDFFIGLLEKKEFVMYEIL